MRKAVYILVGPKGSGKSHIGKLLEEELGIRFLPVEPLLIAHIERFGQPAEGLSRHGFDIEERAIRDVLEEQDTVIFEATGSSEYFPSVVVNLRDGYVVKLIRIHCPLDICFTRVRDRDSEGHLPVTDEMVNAINKNANLVDFDWDLEIDNSGATSNKAIVAQFAAAFYPANRQHSYRR